MMKVWVAVVVTLVVSSLVHSLPLQKRSADGDGDSFLGNLFDTDWLEELQDWAKDAIKPLEDMVDKYKDEEVGFKEESSKLETVNGNTIQVNTTVEKKEKDGSEFLVVHKTMQKADNSTSIQEFQAYIGLKGEEENEEEEDEE